MRNKYKLSSAVIIIIIALASFSYLYTNPNIIGAVIYRDNSGEELPDTEYILLEAKNQATEVPGSDGKQFGVTNRYMIGKDKFCEIDCVTYCVQNSLEFYDAYVQKRGECRCKFLPQN